MNFQFSYLIVAFTSTDGLADLLLPAPKAPTYSGCLGPGGITEEIDVPLPTAFAFFDSFLPKEPFDESAWACVYSYAKEICTRIMIINEKLFYVHVHNK